MTATNTTAQIATFLNVSPNQIKSVTELFYVFCVVVKGQRARFVSKKVVKTEIEEMTDVEKLAQEIKAAGKPCRGSIEPEMWLEQYPTYARLSASNIRNRVLNQIVDDAVALIA
jgi:hypothetical protein